MNKKPLLRSLLLLLTLPAGAGAQEPVQETIYEGSASYQFGYQHASSGRKAAFMPEAMIVHFRVDSVKSVERTSFMLLTRIGTPDSLEKRILLEIPDENKKLELRQTPAAVSKLHQMDPQLGTFTCTGKSKKILGCKAEKYRYSDEKSGKEYEGWFTREIILPQNHYTSFFPEEYGTPLEFTLPVDGIPVRISVTGFSAEIQENGTFTPQENFMPSAYDAFKAACLAAGQSRRRQAGRNRAASRFPAGRELMHDDQQH